MDNTYTEHGDEILILEGDPALSKDTCELVARDFPGADVTATSTLEDCARLLKEKDFDILVLDCDLEELSRTGLVHYLKVKDKEPAVLLISETVSPRFVNEISGIGSQRYLYKRDNWLAELAPALRQLIRIRKLEAENRRLVAQLTEAKMFLEEKNKRLDEFSATVAHDIRGPLGGVSMKLEFILDKYASGMDPKLHSMLERAFHSTQRVIDIVQAMYNYAKLGSKASQMEQIDLKELVQEVINDISFDDSLDIKIGLGELPAIWGNKNLLRRVFINLLTNAVKYNEKEEKIINIGLQAVTEKTIGVFAQIFVADNGRGISARDQQDIFSIFKRGAAKPGDPDGLGVGLSVVRRIVELHYGEVQVESSEGEGARFIISLPLEKLDFLE